MRFEPLSDRAQMILASPVIVPVCIVAIAMVGLAFPVIYPWMLFFRWLERKREERGWHRWFAWRPVMLSGFYYDRADTFAWMEPVDRRWLGGWSYRFPGELDTWERREAAQGTEARRAETTGSACDGPVAEGHAPGGNHD